jgi:hypothetical protein
LGTRTVEYVKYLCAIEVHLVETEFAHVPRYKVMKHGFTALPPKESFVADEDVSCREFPFFYFRDESLCRREGTH